MALTTVVTLSAESAAVELTTSFDNQATDHRVRALVHAPLGAERLDIDQGLGVVARPLDVAALGAGLERPAPTGQHHRFVDISDGARGVAMLTRGLPEHEVVRDGERGTALALTLFRGVGWLSRGDLNVIDSAAGPILPTPQAQELGAHRFEYAVLVHAGDWQAGGVMSEARRFAAPPVVVSPSGKHTVPPARALVEVAPDEVTLTAVHPAETGRGTMVRVVNCSATAREATLRLGFPAREALAVDPMEKEIDRRIEWKDGVCRLQLGPWQIATVLFRT